MKKTFIPILLLMLFQAPLHAADSIQATTQDGKKVVLYPDGTWKYVELKATAEAGARVFLKSPDAVKQVSGSVQNFKISINEDKWAQKESDDPNKLSFGFKKGDAYGLMISERIGMPLASLKKIAISNAQKAAPDLKVVLEEKRTVNGVEILCMQMDGTIDDIPFTYLGYYYTDKNGSLQLLTYTGQNLFEEYKPELNEFLNGLQITPK